MNFQVGQLVDIDHPLLGVVTEKIIEIKPSTYHPTDPIVFFMHEGREWGAFSSRVSIPKEGKSMTEPAATATTEPKRRGRPAKAKPEQVAPAENPFTLGQQVRAKLADGELHECTVATIESPTVIIVEAPSGERFNRHISEVEATEAAPEPQLLPIPHLEEALRSATNDLQEQPPKFSYSPQIVADLACTALHWHAQFKALQAQGGELRGRPAREDFDELERLLADILAELKEYQ